MATDATVLRMRLRTLFAVYLISTAAAIASPFVIRAVEMGRRRLIPVNSEAPLQAAPFQYGAKGLPSQSLMCTSGNGLEYYKSDLFTGGVRTAESSFDLIPDVLVQSCAIGGSGTLYLVGALGNERWLRAYSPTGELKWSDEVEEYCSSPALSDNTLYLICMPHSGNTTLTAYDPDGQPRWRFETNGFDWNPVSPAVGHDGAIYLYSGVQASPEIIAIDSQGKELWNASVPARVSEIAVSGDGTIVANVPAGNVFSFDRGGHPLWHFHADAKVINGGIAIAADGTVYFAAGYLFALDSKGHPKWTFKSEQTYTKGDYFDGDLVIGEDGTIYARSYYGDLYAVTAQGKKKWETYNSTPSLPGLALSASGVLTTKSASYLVGSGLAVHGWPSINHNNQNNRSQESP